MKLDDSVQTMFISLIASLKFFEVVLLSLLLHLHIPSCSCQEHSMTSPRETIMDLHLRYHVSLQGIAPVSWSTPVDFQSAVRKCYLKDTSRIFPSFPVLTPLQSASIAIMFHLRLLALLASLLAAALAQDTFTNPIIDTGADPWMIKYEGYYYLTYTTATNITIWRSRSLVDWENADSKLAFQPPEGEDYSTDL